MTVKMIVSFITVLITYIVIFWILPIIIPVKMGGPYLIRVVVVHGIFIFMVGIFTMFYYFVIKNKRLD